MPQPHQNLRRPQFRQSLQRAWRSLLLGWDFYLFVVGYGLVFGFLGIAAVELPEVGAGMGPENRFGHEPAWSAPDARHWFGVDPEGIDMLGPVLRASGRSIWLALIATLCGSVLGLLIATVFFFIWRERGYRMLDGMAGLMAMIPAVLATLILVAGHGAGYEFSLLMLTGLCAVFVAGRGARWYQDLEAQSGVIAARALGYSRWRMLAEHLATRLWKKAAAAAATLLPGVLMAEAMIGYSGAGAEIHPAAGRIGMLIAAGQGAMFEAPWLVFFPGLMLWTLCVILAAFGWAVRRTLDEPIDDRLF